VECELKEEREQSGVILEIPLGLRIQRHVFRTRMIAVSSHGTFDHSTWNKLINTCCLGYRNVVLCTRHVVLYLDNMIPSILSVSLEFWSTTLSTRNSLSTQIQIMTAYSSPHLFHETGACGLPGSWRKHYNLSLLPGFKPKLSTFEYPCAFHLWGAD
jgi:hypothetical protein